jgi:hypothetical protein
LLITHRGVFQWLPRIPSGIVRTLLKSFNPFRHRSIPVLLGSNPPKWDRTLPKGFNPDSARPDTEQKGFNPSKTGLKPGFGAMRPFWDGFQVNRIAFGRSKDGNRGLKTGFEPFGDGFEPFQKGSNDPGKGSNASNEGSNDPGKGWNDPGEGSNDSRKGSNDSGKGWNDLEKCSNEWQGGSNDFRQRPNNASTGYSPRFSSESKHRPFAGDGDCAAARLRHAGFGATRDDRRADEAALGE